MSVLCSLRSLIVCKCQNTNEFEISLVPGCHPHYFPRIFGPDVHDTSFVVLDLYELELSITVATQHLVSHTSFPSTTATTI